jgi:hypothetical protein
VSSVAVADPIADVLIRVDAGELGDPLPVLAYLAGQAVELDEAERRLPPRAVARCGWR